MGICLKLVFIWYGCMSLVHHRIAVDISLHAKMGYFNKMRSRHLAGVLFLSRAGVCSALLVFQKAGSRANNSTSMQACTPQMENEIKETYTTGLMLMRLDLTSNPNHYSARNKSTLITEALSWYSGSKINNSSLRWNDRKANHPPRERCRQRLLICGFPGVQT